MRRRLERARFHTISDSSFFVGTVALLNSLRMTGHQDDVIVLDRGLSAEQCAILEPHCEIVRVDVEDVGSPAWLKPYPHLLELDAGTIVIVDSDVIVTGSLEGVIDEAAAGQICAFAASSPERWFAEWKDVFDLEATPRRQPYVASGFIALSADRWPDLLAMWWERCERWWYRPYVRGRRHDPLQFLDQDALNALLMTEVPRSAVSVLPREANPFGYLLQQVRTDDPRSLRYSCRGMSTLILHNSGGRKPWEIRGLSGFRKWRPAYVRALRRVLFDADAVVQLSSDRVPVWLRPGPVGTTVERAVSLAASSRYYGRELHRATRRIWV